MKFNGIRRRFGVAVAQSDGKCAGRGRVLGLSPTCRPAHWVRGGKDASADDCLGALEPHRSEHPSTVTLTLLPDRLYVHVHVFVLRSCLTTCVLNGRDALITFVASSSPVMLSRFF